MNSILYGNLRIQLVDGAGARVDRQAPQPTATLTPRPDSARENEPVFLAGRTEELDLVRQAVRDRRLIQVSGRCGFGKTTLLRHVAVRAVAEGLAGLSAYLPAGRGGTADLLHRLISEIYTAEPPAKMTPGQCEQILSQVQALVILDDATLSPAQLDYVRRALPGCSVLVSSQRPIQHSPEDTLELSGLDEEAALQVIADGLGRPLSSGEQPLARQLAQAVHGHPLHLRQAAALAREGQASLAELTEMARRDPGRLDRLSINSLAEPIRQALAVLALAAGAFLPADLVGLMGSVTEIAACLRVLHRRGLAEQRQGRFGLPVCKTEPYRQVLLEDVRRATAVRELVDWLRAGSLTAPDSLSAASAALAVADWAAGGEDWPAVIQLIRVVEPVLTLAGRWQASQEALTRGMQAARAAGDHLSEAFFAHEQGTLALCTDDLSAAQQQLQHALRLREQHGDRDGAAVTRHNLSVLQPAPPPLPRPVHSRPMLPVLLSGGVLAVVGSVAGVLIATAGTSPRSQPTPTPSPVVASSPSSNSVAASTPASTGVSSTPSSGITVGPLARPSVPPAGFMPIDITGHPAPATMMVTIRNPNSRPLAITSVHVVGAPFTITGTTCTRRPVPAQGSCSITVQFAPSGIGGYSQDLTVRSAAGKSTALLSGTGYVELTVVLEGDGQGTVTDAEGIDCSNASGATPAPTRCSQQMTGPVTLAETPAPASSTTSESRFLVWGPPCVDSKQTTCVVGAPAPATTDTNVTATFYLNN